MVEYSVSIMDEREVFTSEDSTIIFDRGGWSCTYKVDKKTGVVTCFYADKIETIYPDGSFEVTGRHYQVPGLTIGGSKKLSPQKRLSDTSGLVDPGAG